MKRALLALLAILAVAAPARADTPWTLVNTYPHDPTAFTEGLFYLDGALYESTGLEGQSDIRKVALKSGKVLQRRIVDPPYFGEGIVNWKESSCYVSAPMGPADQPDLAAPPRFHLVPRRLRAQGRVPL